MPYKKTNRRRRTRRPAAKSVKAIATRVVKNWTPLKEIRFAAPTGQFLTNGTIAQRCDSNHLTSIALGNQVNQRTGDKIYITGIKFDLYCANNSATLDRHFNWCLATDIARGDTLNETTYGNMMEDFQFAALAPSPVNTNFQYTYNTELIKPLRKGRFLVSSVGNKPTRQTSFFWKPHRPHKVQYERVNSNNIISGKIFLLLHLAEAGQVASADTCDYQWRARVYFRST